MPKGGTSTLGRAIAVHSSLTLARMTPFNRPRSNYRRRKLLLLPLSKQNNDVHATDPTVPFHDAPRGHYKERLHGDQAQQTQHVLLRAADSNHKHLWLTSTTIAPLISSMLSTLGQKISPPYEPIQEARVVAGASPGGGTSPISRIRCAALKSPVSEGAIKIYL